MERAEPRLKRRSFMLGGASLVFGGLLPARAQTPAIPAEDTASIAPRMVAALPAAPAPVMAEVRSLSGGNLGGLDLTGRFLQGGFCFGKCAPYSEIRVDGKVEGLSSLDGDFLIGFDRDASPEVSLEIHAPDQSPQAFTISLAAVTYDTQAVNGLPNDTVTPPQDPVLQARIARESVLKAEAFASLADADWFKGGFIYPLSNFTPTGRFGNQRILNGVPKSPHYGFDMAAPTGAKIICPQKGLVVLAEPDLFFEGGLTLIDHGQGLISMYLHQSSLRVAKNDIVEQGDWIGDVGAKGRATGPHLCWRLKWRDRHMDPSLMVTHA
jgi:murein DD-endopeptidase MepM/ murein hydrolase activator NlpD